VGQASISRAALSRNACSVSSFLTIDGSTHKTNATTPDETPNPPTKKGQFRGHQHDDLPQKTIRSCKGDVYLQNSLDSSSMHVRNSNLLLGFCVANTVHTKISGTCLHGNNSITELENSVVSSPEISQQLSNWGTEALLDTEYLLVL